MRVEDDRGSVRDLEGERERLDVVGEHHVRPHVVEKRHGVPHEPVPEVGPLAGARDDARQAGRLVEPRRHRRSGRREVDVARAVVTRRAPHARDRNRCRSEERRDLPVDARVTRGVGEDEDQDVRHRAPYIPDV